MVRSDGLIADCKASRLRMVLLLLLLLLDDEEPVDEVGVIGGVLMPPSGGDVRVTTFVISCDVLGY